MSQRYEKGYFPLSKIEGEELVLERGRGGIRTVTIVSNLKEHAPYANKDDGILINPRRFLPLMKLGAMRSLVIQGRGGDVTSYAATPAGTPSSSGEGVAVGRETVRKADNYTSSSIRSNTLVRPLYDSELIVNLSEMGNRLSQKGKARSSSGWADEFNSVVSKGIRERGVKNVFDNSTIATYLKSALDLAVFSSAAISEGLLGWEGSLREYVGMNVFATLLMWGLSKADNGADQLHPSFSPGTHADRALLLSMRGRAVTLFSSSSRRTSQK